MTEGSWGFPVAYYLRWSDPRLCRWLCDGRLGSRLRRQGDADITRALQSAAGITLTLEPQHHRLFRMRIAQGPFKVNTRRNATLSATSMGHPSLTDRVKGIVSFLG